MKIKLGPQPKSVLVDVHLEQDVVLEFVYSEDDGLEFWQTRVGKQCLVPHNSLTAGSKLNDGPIKDAVVAAIGVPGR